MSYASLSEIAAYLAACFVMGLGIAIDVALASIARTGGLRSAGAMRRWVVRITATHVTFPMIGYYGALQLGRIQAVRPALGILAFVLIFFFLFHMLRELIADREDSEFRPAISEPGWIIVLAVSWDALWSGPAKAAQAVGWNQAQVLLSFPLAGLVVAAAAVMATFSARRLNENAQRLARSASRQAAIEQAAIILEIGVFGYFGFLALFTFTLEPSRPVSFAIAAASIAALIVHVVFGRRIAIAMRRLQSIS